MDGHSDLVLLHESGSVAFWFMNGTAFLYSVVPFGVPEGWRIIGAEDFNWDGNPDIVLQNQDGYLSFWFMKGSSVRRGVVSDQAYSTAWSLVGSP